MTSDRFDDYVEKMIIEHGHFVGCIFTFSNRIILLILLKGNPVLLPRELVNSISHFFGILYTSTFRAKLACKFHVITMLPLLVQEVLTAMLLTQSLRCSPLEQFKSTELCTGL
jgi:hypothetical protein